MKKIKLGKEKISNEDKLVWILGPCAMESEKLIMQSAEALNKIAYEKDITIIFKNSFDKANRTSIKSFRGPGLKKGIRILKKVKQNFDLPLLVDFHLPQQAEEVAQAADILQIPAFLCRQTDMYIAAAKTKKIINVKKGQFISPWEIKNIINKAKELKIKNLLITERGNSFGYNNWVVDMRGMQIMKDLGANVVFDCTHSVQLPGAGESCSSGNREFAFVLAKSAVAVGISALFAEIHFTPSKALCDAANMIDYKTLKENIDIIKDIDLLIKNRG